MNALGAAGLAISMLAGIGMSPQPADVAICDADVVEVSQLGAWNGADCSGVGQQVMIPDGRVGDFPDPGWTVTASSATAAGY